MKITFNPAVGVKQPTFRAVNLEYLKRAQKSYLEWGNLSGDWLLSLEDSLVLFKEISKQDALDTMNAVRKYVNKGSMDFFESKFNYIKNYSQAAR